MTAYTSQAKNFVKITLSHTISEINAFLRFTQKFKMATKNWWENNFWQKVPDDSVHTPEGQKFC